MIINIKLSDKKEITVKNVSLRKLRALRSLHGNKNIALVLDFNLTDLNY